MARATQETKTHTPPLVRDEAAKDLPDIDALTRAAFANLAVSRQTEHFIVEALRMTGALTVSLVAELDGCVVGHIAFSPVSLSDGTPHWYGLGPVSVLPAFQRCGVGFALIKEGLARLRTLGARGCCLVGHPGYYGRFGFTTTEALRFEGVPAEFFFVLPFDGIQPKASVVFHDAFKAEGRPKAIATASPGEAAPRSRDPLHGITLEAIVTRLAEEFGWTELARRIPIRCFQYDPSVKSSLTFLRKTPWARKKVEEFYIDAMIPPKTGTAKR